MSTPTLDELFEKFRYLLNGSEFTQHSESFETYFRLVASGQAEPLRLSDSNAVMAAQCVIIVLEHVKRMEAEGL